MLAEVSDKLPSIMLIWFTGIIASAVVYALCRLHWSLPFFLLPFCGWVFWQVRCEFFTDIQSAIIEEQGIGYLVQTAVSASLPSVIALLFATKNLRLLFGKIGKLSA